MSAVTRVLGLLSVLLSVAFFVACVGGIVGAWMAKKPLTEGATRLFTRAEDVLGEIATNLRAAQEVLARAQASLGSVQRTSADVVADPKKNSPLVKVIVRQVATDIDPKVGDVRQKLGAVVDTATVVNTILDNLNEIPLVSVSRLDADRLQATSGQLTVLAEKAEQLRALLPETNNPDATAAAVQSRASDIQEVLSGLQAVAAEYEPRVVGLRDRVAEDKSRVAGWIHWGTIILTLVLGWLALSQVSMLCHGWGWLRKGG
jgi:hypothetical protein